MDGLNFLILAMTMVYVALVLYMRYGWGALKTFREDKTLDVEYPKVSVLIAARNEEDNIGKTLECLIAQDFPQEKLEIIVIDDHSTDHTSDVVKAFTDRGVRLLQLDEGDKLNSYKKLAISRAIDISEGEIIVTTDADCLMGKNWLRTIIRFVSEKSLDMASSPVIYHQEKSGFERLQTLEFLYLIGLGAAGIGNQSPTTCNGANLAYRKTTFFEVGGFMGIDDVASGDDELLLHKVAAQNPHKIGFCKSRDAIVYTEAKPNLSSFLSQRRRWASKSTKYKDKRVVVLGVCIWLFNLLFLIGAGYFVFCLPTVNIWFAIAYLMKVGIEFIFLYPLTVFARRTSLLAYLPFLSLVHCVYFVYIGLMGNVGRYDWKGRTVK